MTGRHRPLGRKLLNRVANPFVVGLLRSPLHGLLDRHLLLVTLRGRRTGLSFTFPVSYVTEGDDVIAISARDRVWWRNLTGGTPVVLRLRGTEVAATGEALEGSSAAGEALAEFGPQLLRRDISATETARLATQVVVVRFRQLPSPTT